MIVAITSGKGGTGKSTLAANLSVIAPKPTLLVDVDFGMSNLNYFFDVYPPYSLYDFLFKGKTWGEIKTKVREGIDLILAGQGREELADLQKDDREKILKRIEEEKKNYKTVILDTGPGIGRNVIDFLCLADKVVVVVTPDMSSITDSYWLIKALSFEKKKLDIVLVFNRVKEMKEALTIFTNIKNVASSSLGLSVSFAGFLTSSNNIQKAVKAQKLFIEKHTGSHLERQLSMIGGSIWTET